MALGSIMSSEEQTMSGDVLGLLLYTSCVHGLRPLRF